MRRIVGVLLLLATAFVPGCKPSKSISVFPDKNGTAWVYEEAGSEEGQVVTVTESISAAQVGQETYVVLTESFDGATASNALYQWRDGQLLMMGHSIGTDPLEGVTWLDQPHKETTSLKEDQEWTEGDFVYRVIGRQSVTVRAGTFDTLVVEMTYTGYYTDRLYYADGVGLVKEEGANWRELISFTSGK